jgi:F-type H+-transporting ATPase subunit b
MLVPLHLVAESAEGASGFGALGVSASAFVIQLITFVFVFAVLKKFAFAPIVRVLQERRKTISDGVKLGQKMEKEQAKLEQTKEVIIRESRQEADKIVATAHKEAREIAREAEKAAARKTETILADAEIRINEENERAKRKLEKDIVSLVSEATEAIVGEKVDPKKDAAIIDKILKDRTKK